MEVCSILQLIIKCDKCCGNVEVSEKDVRINTTEEYWDDGMIG